MTRETCSCCQGVSVATPRATENRPGLDHLDYRVGCHGDFFESLVARLTHQSRPALGALTTRDLDDFTLALLDGWSVIGDVLTFYNERLSNEAYLRTARERLSLQELGRLLGYQLAPGAAAQTHLAFSVEHPPVVPVTAIEPGTAPLVVPESVVLEPGIRVQSTPGPGEKPQTFETVEEIEARPEWNAITAATTVPWNSTSGITTAWLKGVGLNLAPGDVFLLAGTDITGERWDVRVLDRVTPDPDNDRTEVAWSPGLGSTDPTVFPASDPTAHVFRKRLNVFGYNAPMWGAMSDEFQGDYPGGSTSLSEWPDFDISDGGGTTVDLDGAHPDIVVGSWAVLNRPNYRELWRVAAATELARAEFAISGKVTRLTLADGENYSIFDNHVRSTTVYAASEELTLVDRPDTTPVTGATVEVDADVASMPAGRKLIVTGRTTAGSHQAELASLESVTEVGGRWRLTLAEALANDYERATVVINANVALATHGETVTEILGSGRAATTHQRFGLSHQDLTFVQSPTDPSGVADTLQVRVNGVTWEQAPTLYDAGATDIEYTTRLDQAGSWTVAFGDGVRGSRLPTGSENVVAEYRYGLGRAGNVATNALTQLLDRPLGAKGVTNPQPADGGVDPEPESAARHAIPLKVRTLGRAVSLLDYADFARAFTGVSKAQAVVLPLSGIRTIVVTVAFTPDTVADPGAKAADIETALREFGDPLVQVKVLAHHQATFRLGLRVGVVPGHLPDDVLAALRAAMAAGFGFEARDLGQVLYRSEIVAAAHSVTGVAAVDIDRMYRRGSSPSLVDRLLPRLAGVTPGGAARAGGILVIDDDPFDSLEVMA